MLRLNFRSLREQYFADSRVYYGVIPDKNFYLAEANGFPHLDYGRLDAILAEDLEDWTRIELSDCLDAGDYYKTDSHWRQEKLEPVAQRIAESLGVGVTPFTAYETHTFADFRGVYWGQWALQLPAEPLHYLSSDLLEDCTVHHYETGKRTEIVRAGETERSRPLRCVPGRCGCALLTITNPNANTDRELILSRFHRGAPCNLPAGRSTDSAAAQRAAAGPTGPNTRRGSPREGSSFHRR